MFNLELQAHAVHPEDFDIYDNIQGVRVAKVYGNPVREGQAVELAALFSAAPDLAETLRRLLAAVGDFASSDMPSFAGSEAELEEAESAARAALRKAGLLPETTEKDRHDADRTTEEEGR